MSIGTVIRGMNPPKSLAMETVPREPSDGGRGRGRRVSYPCSPVKRF